MSSDLFLPLMTATLYNFTATG